MTRSHRRAFAAMAGKTTKEDAQSEGVLHSICAEYLRVAYPSLWWWHVPNQGKMPVQWRVKLARMGVKPGISDICVMLNDGRTGYIELKTTTGRPSPAQRAFKAECERVGAPYHIARRQEEFAAVLKDWKERGLVG